jgi:hypothetical protein
MIIDMKILALSQCFCDTFDENIVDRQKIFRRVNKGLAQVRVAQKIFSTNLLASEKILPGAHGKINFLPFHTGAATLIP